MLVPMAFVFCRVWEIRALGHYARVAPKKVIGSESFTRWLNGASV